MRFQRILHALTAEPWLITPTAYATLRQIVQSRLLQTGAVEPQAGMFDDWAVKRPEMKIDDNDIAHVWVHGPIGKGLAKIEKSCGATDINDVAAEIENAQRSRVSALMLHVDSPGGTTTGVPELARVIGDLDIPVAAWTESVAASAAYYLIAGADRIFGTETADVGSIGVYIPWADWTGYAERMGIEPNPVVSTGSSLKGIGLWPTLSEEHRAHLQDLVDEVAKNFKGHVTRFRAIDEDAMNGGTWFGQQALSRNLVDVVTTYDHAYQWLLNQI